MKLDDLRYFLEIEKTKSITDAAKRLFISQQGLSKALRCLEEKLQVSLFIRNANSMVLTAEGLVFAEYAKRVINDHDNLCAKMSMLSLHNKNQENNECNIFATPYIIHYLLTDIYLHLKQHFPHLNIKFYEKSPEQIKRSLPTNKPNTICISDIPCYMFEDFKQGTDDKLVFNTMFQATVMAKVSSKSMLANKKVLRTQEIGQHPLAAVSDSTLTGILSHLLCDSKLDNVVIETDSQRLIDQVINDNDTVVGFSDTFLEATRPHPDFVAIPIQDSVTMFVGLIYSRDNPPSNHTLEISEYISKMIPRF